MDGRERWSRWERDPVFAADGSICARAEIDPPAHHHGQQAVMEKAPLSEWVQRFLALNCVCKELSEGDPVQ
jgi:hypothetical protein